MLVHHWHRMLFFLFAGFLLVGVLLPFDVRAENEPLQPRPLLRDALGPLIESYCIDCHGGDEAEAGFSLEKMLESPEVNRHRKAWQKALKQIRTGKMPPEESDALPDADRAAAIEWLDAELKSFDCSGPQRPGHVTLRRLNLTEYQNTIHDLMGVDFDPRETFPRDTLGYGFDNIGEVLSLSPLLVEKYLDAAEKISAATIMTSESNTDSKPLPASHRLVLPRSPSSEAWQDATAWREAAAELVGQFLGRAYRRPAAPDEIERAVQLLERARQAGDSFERAMRAVVQMALVSPNFLFRGESLLSDVSASDIQSGEGSETVDHSFLLNEYQLATRLSYFLWSTMPDEELRSEATSGTLRKNLGMQLDRMLESERADQFVTNFGEQWLEVRRLETLEPNAELFPNFDQPLAKAMREETFLLLRDVLRNDLPIVTLLSANYSFLNERLASHYEIEGVEGDNFRRVQLPEIRQAGLLVHGSVLAVTSHPDRTSPVLRGKWIMQHLLNDAPPPPPMAIDLSEDPQKSQGKSLRERLEIHRASPSCSVCHETMDQLGFALENFDPLGQWREDDGEFPVDSSGRLPDGREFSGPTGLREVLVADLDVFRKCLVEQVLTYALGRGLQYYDQCAVEQIAVEVREQGDTLSAIVKAVVYSVPFQRGER